MNKSIAMRIGMDAAMAVSVVFGWWYIALVIGIVGLFRFSYYAELLCAGFVYDALFGMGMGGPSGLGFFAAYAGTLVTAAFSGLAAFLKGSVR